MRTAIVTGCGGLVGSEACKFLLAKEFRVIGIDNNLRQYFFGKDGSVQWNIEALKMENGFDHIDADIRRFEAIKSIFLIQPTYDDIKLVVHTAAQPSHDWAAKEPLTDFGVNAQGTLNMLEATRLYAPKATFIFTSTSKVYGDAPNRLPFEEQEKRWDVVGDYYHGIPEDFTIDQSLHSVFGASKVAADIMAQEYGRYFGLNVGVFRGGCLTGPAHSGAELHGFLSYLVKCAITGKPYKIYGYKGKQVRDNIHSKDLVNAFWHFHENPRKGEVYNIGAGRKSDCSILEAIDLIEKLSGKRVNYEILDTPRIGDHKWWISDIRKFQRDYPEWKCEYDLEKILEEIIKAMVDRA